MLAVSSPKWTNAPLVYPITSLIKPVVIDLKEGNDTLNGSGVATDLIVNGGAGNDTLMGGAGNDVLQGG